MYNDVLFPRCLVDLRRGRALLQMMNGTSDWKVIPKIRRLGTLEKIEVADKEFDEKLIDAVTEEIYAEVESERISLLAPHEVVDHVPTKDKENPQLITDEQWKSFKFGDQLTPEEIAKLKKIIQKYRKCFAFSMAEMGCVNYEPVVIDTGDKDPVFQRQFRHSQMEKDEIRRQVTEGVLQGIMSPSNSPYNSPVFLVPKKDGTRRLVVDFRKLNAQCVQNCYLIPRIDDALEQLSGASIFILLDAI